MAGDLTKPLASDELSEGRRMIAAAFFGIGSGWITFQIVAGIFIVPMQANLGWSRGALSIGPIGALLTMLFYLPCAALIDRLGPRPVAIFGLLAFAAAVAGFAIIPPDPLAYALAVILLAVSGAACTPIVYSKGLTDWFGKRLGTATGLAMTGPSVLSAAAIPLLAAIIAGWGWQAGFLTLSAMILVLGVPTVTAWFHMRKTDAAPAQPPVADHGPDMRGVLKDGRFYHLLAGIALASLSIGGFLGSLQPILTGAGHSSASAAWLGSIFAIAIAVGRLGVGFLFDRAFPPTIAAVALAAAGVGTILLGLVIVGSLPTAATALAIAMIGFAQGAESDFMVIFAMRLFGSRSFTRTYSILLMSAGGCMALGGLAFAAIYDNVGTYVPAICGAAIAYLASAALFLRLPMARAAESPSPM